VIEHRAAQGGVGEYHAKGDVCVKCAGSSQLGEHGLREIIDIAAHPSRARVVHLGIANTEKPEEVSELVSARFSVMPMESRAKLLDPRHRYKNICPQTPKHG